MQGEGQKTNAVQVRHGVVYIYTGNAKSAWRVFGIAASPASKGGGGAADIEMLPCKNTHTVVAGRVFWESPVQRVAGRHFSGTRLVLIPAAW